MSIAQSTAAVIPCLNEARGIADLVGAVLGQVGAVLVVDDGSTDATGKEARRAGATVLRHERTEGKGAALRTGLAEAREAGFAWALTMDGDGQHSPQDIPDFLAEAVVSNARMIVGNRMGDSVRMPFIRRQVNRWMSARLSAHCGAVLPDSQCGFRMIHLDSWAAFDFSSRHFEIESELLVRFLHAGLEVAFVPVETRYGGERSKIHPVRDTVRWFRWWGRMRREPAGRKVSRTSLPEAADLPAAS